MEIDKMDSSNEYEKRMKWRYHHGSPFGLGFGFAFSSSNVNLWLTILLSLLAFTITSTMAAPTGEMSGNETIMERQYRDDDGAHALKCVQGLFVPLWTPLTHLTMGERLARGFAYFLGLCYLFVGVSIVSDRFMASIEVITSKEREIVIKKASGEKQVIVVRIWNETVANLTLMALGSSAPEILLSIIEMFAKGWQAGDLGPGTIVGSAAFNLFVITAIAIVCIPKGESRKIKHLRVFFVTAFFSLFAYIWLYLILSYITPGRVDVWEGLVTFALFPVTVILAYMADRRMLVFKFTDKYYRLNKRGVIVSGERENELQLSHKEDDIRTTGDTPEENAFEEARREYITLLKELRKKYPQSDLEQLEMMAQEHLINKGPKSRAFYRIQATRKMVGSGNIMRKLADKTANEMNEVKAQLTRVNVNLEEEEATVRVFFDPGHYTVMESCGEFEVRVVRRGDLSGYTTVEFQTEDGSAEAGSDYVGKKGVLTFPPGVDEQRFKIEVIDDDIFEQDEHFYIRLSNPSDPAVLSVPKVATVMILDDDHAGIFAFTAKEFDFPETIGIYSLKVQRFSGARGKVIVPYWTEDGTAKAGKEYEPQQGELLFENNETEKFINIPITEEGSYDKNVLFFVNLGSPIMSSDNHPSKKDAFRFLNKFLDDEMLGLIQAAESKRPEDLTEEDKIALLGRPISGEITRVQMRITESADFKNTVDKLVQRANASIVIGTSTWKEQFVDALTVNPSGDDGDEEGDTTPNCCDYVMHFITLFWKIIFAFIPPTELYSGYLCFVVSISLIGLITAIVGDFASYFGCTLGVKDSVTAICFVALGTSIPDTFASKIAAVQDETADNSIGNVTGSNAVNVFLGIGIAWTMAAIYHEAQGSYFYVEPGSLAFSVFMFLIGATMVISILIFRRRKSIGGELGGPPVAKWTSGAILVLIWATYVTLSTLEAYGVIVV